VVKFVVWEAIGTEQDSPTPADPRKESVKRGKRARAGGPGKQVGCNLFPDGCKEGERGKTIESLVGKKTERHQKKENGNQPSERETNSPAAESEKSKWKREKRNLGGGGGKFDWAGTPCPH